VLPHVTISQLEYLVAVDETESWAKAAERVGVSPSALSQGLAEMERRLGLRLFGRQGRRRVMLDEAGEVVAYARRVLAETGDLARWIQRTQHGSRGSLRIGMIDVVAVHHAAQVLRSFRNTQPDVDLMLTVAPSGQLARDLTAGELDLAVLVESPELDPALEVGEYLSEELMVYRPGGAEAEAADIEGPAHWGPWVGYPRGSHTRQLIMDALRRRGASTEYVAESHQPEVLCEMVRLGIGWVVLPTVQAEARPDQLTRADGPALLERRLLSARRRGAPDNPALDLLVENMTAAQG